jgi:hypothetical protein
MSSTAEPRVPRTMSDQQPDNTTILITGEGEENNQVWISLPESGNLWVAFEIGTGSATVFIWHQGGPTTPVPPGFNTYPVNATDALVYQLGSPTDSIKLGWAYV